MQGLAPTFIGEFSDNAGRRPAYLVCGTIYIAANIGLACQDSYAALMVLRCVQSAGSSGTVALAQAVVADVVTSSERGIYVSYASVAPQVGPALGPIFGGLLASYVGWHFIFWFLVILAGVIWAPLALFFPETCRKIVEDGSVPPPKLNRCVTNIVHDRRAVKKGTPIPWEKHDELGTRRGRRLRFPNPFLVLRLIFQKQCGPALLFIALVCCGLYSTVALIPSQFGRIYGFNVLQISLCYIPFGCGTMTAAFVRGRMIDSRFKHYAKKLGVEVVKNRKLDLTDFPIERARIEVALPTLFLGSACQIAFGWTVQYETNLAGPLILLFFIGFCVSATMNSIQVLMIDVYPGRAGAVTAANNLLRCLLGAGATALVLPMINAIGIGWTCSFFAFVVLATSPVLWYIMKQGPNWRREKDAKKRRQMASSETPVGLAGGGTQQGRAQSWSRRPS
jgi:MFS family permease